MTQQRIELGKKSESIAADFLEKQGWSILERNYRCTLGEIDIIAERIDEVAGAFRKTIALVEVKSRRRRPGLRPEHQMTLGKRRRLVRLAKSYIRARRVRARVRFDVVAVEWNAEEYVVRHHESAFDANGHVT